MSLRQFHTVLAGDASAKALTAVFVLALVRLLSPEQLADFVFLSALVALAGTLFNGFFNRLYILAPVQDSPNARSYRAWQVGSAGAVYAVAAFATADDAKPGALLIGFACAVFAANFDFRRTHVQKSLQFARYSSADVLRAAIQLVLALPAAVWGGDRAVTLLLAAQAVAYGSGTLILPPLPQASKSAPDVWRALASRDALALLAYFALVGLLGQLPVLLLKQLGGAPELAAFGSAFRYYGLLLGVVVAANVVLLPRIAQHAADRSPGQSSAVIVLVGIGLIVSAMVTGFFAIPFIDGGKYPQAPTLFVILSLGLIPGVILAPITASLLREGRSGELLASQLAAMASCVAAVWLLREHGPLAVACSTPVAVAVQFCWLGAVTLRRHRTATVLP